MSTQEPGDVGMAPRPICPTAAPASGARRSPDGSGFDDHRPNCPTSSEVKIASRGRSMSATHRGSEGERATPLASPGTGATGAASPIPLGDNALRCPTTWDGAGAAGAQGRPAHVGPVADVRAAPPAALLDHHRAHLAASGIPHELIAERGYYSATTKADLERLGFAAPQRQAPALVVPVHGVAGRVGLHIIRPDHPRIVNGKPLKYEVPKGARMQLDAPPRVRTRLSSLTVPLFVTEGIKKADAAAACGLCCVAVLGIWNWRGQNESGGKLILPDFDYLALDGRQVYIAFDSDVALNPDVHGAMERLASALELKGASPHYIYLPPADGGLKVGLDDFFVAGGTVDDLLGHATTELRRVSRDSSVDTPLYASRDGSLWQRRGDPQSPTQTKLTTFIARIVAEDLHDDGAETTLFLHVEGECGDRSATAEMPATEFAAMDWPIKHLGTGAYILAEPRAKHHVANAIQEVSRSRVVHRTTYAHSGWREIDGAWLYLHGGGAIGGQGLRDDVRVLLPHQLRPFILPAPPTGGQLAEALRACLRLLDLGPPHIAAPTFCAPWRAAVREIDLSLSLIGETGAFKSERAALMQQHFGIGFHRSALPTGFTSTVNSIELLAHAMKDAILVVDDFAPVGSAKEVAQKHGDLDRLLRSSGNSQGRGRLRPDGTACPVRAPRSLVVTTGETDARMRSATARTVTVRMRIGDIRADALTRAQDDARAGLYAAGMSAFVMWLAARRDTVLRGWEARVGAVRHEISHEEDHRRVPSNVAELLAASRLLFDFAAQEGGLSAHERSSIEGRLHAGMIACMAEVAETLASADPVALFRDLLRAAVQSGGAHIASASGDAPPEARSLGWQACASDAHPDGGARGLIPRGDRIGWLDDQHLLLSFDAALRVVRELGEAAGRPLTAGPLELKRMLLSRHLILKHEKDRYDAKGLVAGNRTRVMFLARSWVLPEEAEFNGPEQVVL